MSSHISANIQLQSTCKYCHPTSQPEKIKPSVEGRALLELRDGRLTIYPVTTSDEETRLLLAAILDHIAEAIRN